MAAGSAGADGAARTRRDRPANRPAKPVNISARRVIMASTSYQSCHAYRPEAGLRAWSLTRIHLGENIMANEKGPNIKKKQKCKNCEGKGLLKKGDKVVKFQRCGGTGVR